MVSDATQRLNWVFQLDGVCLNPWTILFDSQPRERAERNVEAAMDSDILYY